MSAVCLGLLVLVGAADAALPDRFWVTEGQSLSFENGLPVRASVTEFSEKAVSVSEENSSAQAATVRLDLFGVVPIKTAQVQAVPSQKVVPLGDAFGVKLFTDGVLVAGMTPVETSSGSCLPAKEAGLKAGDVILAVDGQTVTSNGDLAACVEQSGGQTLSLSVRRDGTLHPMTLTPVQSIDGSYKAGIWVRDSSAGIGTLTFFDPLSSTLAGLGHGVCDVDTGALLPALSGELVSAEILGVTPARSGVTGELKGRFSSGEKLATLQKNCDRGIYGRCDIPYGTDRPAVEVAMRHQIKTGPATILSGAGGSVEEYDICIVEVRLKDNDSLQNMVIEVTDPELLEKTGGIVQGMSGSPILQKGMLVGAVTHVFVNNPQKGYAIFAETMLDQAA